MKDYYFITYAAHMIPEGMRYWNDVIDVSPMQYIKDVEATESLAEGSFYDFVIISVLPITYAEFNKWDGQF